MIIRLEVACLVAEIQTKEGMARQAMGRHRIMFVVLHGYVWVDKAGHCRTMLVFTDAADYAETGWLSMANIGS